MKLTEDDFYWDEEYGTIVINFGIDKSKFKPTRDEILKNQKIVEELEYRKKYPQPFNYAQFEVWVTDILNGGNGFPTLKIQEKEK